MSPEPAGLHAWTAAVELGAQGRAAAARCALAALDADRATAASIRSLAHSTRASLIRQAGGHAAARAGDGRACSVAVAATGDPGDPWLDAAWLDGLIGLAADNLGLADFAASARLLDRAAAHAGAAAAAAGSEVDWQTLPRTALRLSWVRSEWGLYSGDLAVARAAAAASAELAADLPSPRHRIKTDLIAAAVAAAGGETAAADRGARAAHARAGELGLLPLRWAAATLLAGLRSSDQTGEQAVYQGEVTELRDRLALRGMPLAPLRPGERHGR
ncbi:hypothetical protein [Gordonia caeni]|uniref:Uncharacterized protein n=1 Tax=Gordonia caeni TaxID=1007097 RepID=A0ABP7PHT7_9ACTN